MNHKSSRKKKIMNGIKKKCKEKTQERGWLGQGAGRAVCLYFPHSAVPSWEALQLPHRLPHGVFLPSVKDDTKTLWEYERTGEHA